MLASSPRFQYLLQIGSVYARHSHIQNKADRAFEDFPREIANAELLNADDEARALRMGLACRLAFALSGSSVGALPRYALRMTPGKIVLDVPRRDEAIAVELLEQAANERRLAGADLAGDHDEAFTLVQPAGLLCGHAGGGQRHLVAAALSGVLEA